MTGFPSVQVLIAFTSDYSAATASWVDVTQWAMDFNTKRGRSGSEEVCNPGTLNLSLDNTDGRFDPDNTSGPYYGYIRPNRRVRVQATVSGTVYYLFSGYVDSWTRTWPGGAEHSVTAVKATDRMKLMARRQLAFNSRPDEKADARLNGLLDNAGSAIVPSISRAINTPAYNTRNIVAHDYDGGDALTACQDISRADGGALFVDGQGFLVFQSTRFRTDNALSTTSNGTFGNTAGAIQVEDSLDPKVDDSIMANRVLVTDGNGTVVVEEDTTFEGKDGVLEIDLGSTLLAPTDAPDRANDVLLLRKDPRPRYDSCTFNALVDDAAMTQALTREISDRITLAITPPVGTAMSRDQYVEGVEQNVTVSGSQQWLTTFQLSGAYGGARVLP